MSVHYSSAVWKIKMPNSGRKLIAVALADMASDDGVCWPSIKSLQERCDMGENAVRDHLSHLEAIRLIKRSPRFKNNRQTSNLYTFMPLAELVQTWGVQIRIPSLKSGGGRGAISDTQNHQKECAKRKKLIPEADRHEPKPCRPTISSQIDIYSTEPRDV